MTLTYSSPILFLTVKYPESKAFQFLSNTQGHLRTLNPFTPKFSSFQAKISWLEKPSSSFIWQFPQSNNNSNNNKQQQQQQQNTEQLLPCIKDVPFDRFMLAEYRQKKIKNGYIYFQLKQTDIYIVVQNMG